MIRSTALVAPSARSAPFALAAKGFRPFFLLAAAFAALAVPQWLLVLTGKLTLPSGLPGAMWHAHEMVFGFTVAVITGFLLTAASRWTERETIVGLPLMALAGVWIAGRLAMVLPVPTVVAMFTDALFLPLVAFFVGRPIVQARSGRNFGIVAVLLLLAACNVLTHLDALGHARGWGRRALLLSVDAVVLLMIVIGARVIPLFTRNATRVDGIRSIRQLDHLAMAAFGAAAALEVGSGPSLASSALCALAAVLLLARTWHWGFRAALRDPMLWVLHIGHGWIAVGLLFRSAESLVPAFGSAGTHAITAGAIGTLTLGMMCRVALGHTGRFLKATRNTPRAFALVIAAALARTTAPLLPHAYLPLLVASAVAWSLAFVIFLVDYTLMLATPRPDGAAG
jgi:uncharacterized protein involved in response to NO